MASLSKVGLAPGITVVNGRFYLNGQPLTQERANQLNNGGFVPYQPPSTAPPGTYDPSLDAQAENANLGFGFSAQDFDLQNARLSGDYSTGLDRLQQAHGATLGDLLTGLNRAGQDYNTQLGQTNEDYGTAGTRLNQDYGRTTQDLSRQYTDLGSQQAGAIRASGAGEGGALAAALAKRTANQGRDQSGIDLNYQRGQQDLNTQHARQVSGLGTAWDRYQQDYGTNVARENQQNTNQQYDLGLGYQRGTSDLLTNYGRAGVANDAFQRQVNGLKVYQAQQQGLLPEGPSNEHIVQTGPNAGQSYRTELHNGVVYHRYPDGRMVPIRKASS